MIWEEWFCSQIKSFGQVAKNRIIINALCNGSHLDMLGRIAESTKNEDLIERIEMERILENDNPTEQQMNDAVKYFMNIGENKKAQQLKRRLPDNLINEIDGSDNILLNDFIDLIERVIESEDDDTKKALVDKIINRKDRFNIHSKIKISDSLPFEEYKNDDLVVFWNLLNDDNKYKFFKYYYNVHDDLKARVIRQIKEEAFDLQDEMKKLNDIGNEFDFLNERWTQYGKLLDYDKVFAEAALCSIILDLQTGKSGSRMTKDMALVYADEKLGIDTNKSLTYGKMVGKMIFDLNELDTLQIDNDFLEKIIKGF